LCVYELLRNIMKKLHNRSLTQPFVFKWFALFKIYCVRLFCLGCFSVRRILLRVLVCFGFYDDSCVYVCAIRRIYSVLCCNREYAYSYVWHDPLVMCDMTRSLRVTWRIHTCDITHSLGAVLPGLLYDIVLRLRSTRYRIWGLIIYIHIYVYMYMYTYIHMSTHTHIVLRLRSTRYWTWGLYIYIVCSVFQCVWCSVYIKVAQWVDMQCDAVRVLQRVHESGIVSWCAVCCSVCVAVCT